MWGDDAIRRLQLLLKMLAEDSVAQNNYVVVVATSSAKLAKRILDANGRQKIVSVASSPGRYKWSPSMCTKYIQSRIAARFHAIHNRKLIVSNLVKIGMKAGTPGFLRKQIEAVATSADEVIMKHKLRLLDAEAKLIESHWTRGQEEVETIGKFE